MFFLFVFLDFDNNGLCAGTLYALDVNDFCVLVDSDLLIMLVFSSYLLTGLRPSLDRPLRP